MEENKILFETEIPGGWNWSHRLKRGTSLRLTALQAGANVSALFYNAHDFSERYNMADTLKAQFISYYTKGHALYSDMGRILVSIIDDNCGWHDTISGVSYPALVKEKYGEKNYQDHRNKYVRDGETSLIMELGKYNMGLKDLVANVNFFSKIAINEAGEMEFVSQHSNTGDHIDLQAEMDTLVILNTCPNPMDPNPDYAPKKIKCTVWDSAIPTEENPAHNFCEQNERGFTRTIQYQL